MVLKGHPSVDLISSMGPYLDEFSVLIDPNRILKSGPANAQAQDQ